MRSRQPRAVLLWGFTGIVGAAATIALWVNPSPPVGVGFTIASAASVAILAMGIAGIDLPSVSQSATRTRLLISGVVTSLWLASAYVSLIAVSPGAKTIEAASTMFIVASVTLLGTLLLTFEHGRASRFRELVILFGPVVAIVALDVAASRITARPEALIVTAMTGALLFNAARKAVRADPVAEPRRDDGLDIASLARYAAQFAIAATVASIALAAGIAYRAG